MVKIILDRRRFLIYYEVLNLRKEK